jgi:hypothetical protein
VASTIVNKFGASFTDNAIVVIYDHHTYIAQATDPPEETQKGTVDDISVGQESVEGNI